MNGESPAASDALTCGTARKQITAFVDGELNAADAARLEEHVAGCEVCAPVLAQVRAMKSVLPAWSVDEKFIAERVEARVSEVAPVVAESVRRPRHRTAGRGLPTRPSGPGDILVDYGKIEEEILSKARVLAEATETEVSQMLVRLGLVSERDAVQARALHQGVPFIDLRKHQPEPAALRTVSAEVARRLSALPVKKDGQRLWVAMENPRDVSAIDELHAVSRCMVQPMAAAPGELRAELDAAYGPAGAQPPPPPPPTAVAADAPPPGRGPDDDAKLTFEEVQRKYEGKVFSLIFNYTGDRETAEDLTVETFVNAWRQWDRLRGEPRADLWLYRITLTHCKERWKNPTPSEGGIAGTSAPQMRKAVDALRPEYRAVFVLAQDANMTFEEIAAITQLTIPAVKARLHRARGQVRRVLEGTSQTTTPGDIDNEAAGGEVQDELRELRGMVAALVEETRGLRSEVKELRRELSVRTAPARRAAGPAARPSLFAPPDPPSRFS